MNLRTSMKKKNKTHSKHLELLQRILDKAYLSS